MKRPFWQTTRRIAAGWLYLTFLVLALGTLRTWERLASFRRWWMTEGKPNNNPAMW